MSGTSMSIHQNLYGNINFYNLDKFKYHIIYKKNKKYLFKYLFMKRF